jgi:hypothetical protein
MRHDRVQFRKFVLVGFDKSQLILGDVVLEEDGLVLRHRDELADAFPHLFWVKVQALRDGVGVGI